MQNQTKGIYTFIIYYQNAASTTLGPGTPAHPVTLRPGERTPRGHGGARASMQKAPTPYHFCSWPQKSFMQKAGSGKYQKRTF